MGGIFEVIFHLLKEHTLRHLEDIWVAYHHQEAMVADMAPEDLLRQDERDMTLIMTVHTGEEEEEEEEEVVVEGVIVTMTDMTLIVSTIKKRGEWQQEWN